MDNFLKYPGVVVLVLTVPYVDYPSFFNRPREFFFFIFISFHKFSWGNVAGLFERHNFEFVELPFPSSDVVFTPVNKMSGDTPMRLLQNVTSLEFPHRDLHLLIHGSPYLRDGERSMFILNNESFLYTSTDAIPYFPWYVRRLRMPDRQCLDY